MTTLQSASTPRTVGALLIVVGGVAGIAAVLLQPAGQVAGLLALVALLGTATGLIDLGRALPSRVAAVALGIAGALMLLEFLLGLLPLLLAPIGGAPVVLAAGAAILAFVVGSVALAVTRGLRGPLRWALLAPAAADLLLLLPRALPEVLADLLAPVAFAVAGAALLVQALGAPRAER